MTYVQYCETHQSYKCKPARCPDVRLYHWIPRVAHELTCQAPHCGVTFTANRSDAKFHSPACRQYARRHPSRVTDKAA
jgi:hypothetical protein